MDVLWFDDDTLRRSTRIGINDLTLRASGSRHNVVLALPEMVERYQDIEVPFRLMLYIPRHTLPTDAAQCAIALAQCLANQDRKGCEYRLVITSHFVAHRRPL